MFHKTIETTADAVEFLQTGKKASDILDRLDQLTSLLGTQKPQEEDDTEA